MEGDIRDLIPKLKKSDFVFHRPQTLFGVQWGNLKLNLCPYCSCKLYPMLKKQGWFICRSKKHKKPFLISETKKKEVVDKLIDK